jgi:hypothetical protein
MGFDMERHGARARQNLEAPRAGAASRKPNRSISKRHQRSCTRRLPAGMTHKSP